MSGILPPDISSDFVKKSSDIVTVKSKEPVNLNPLTSKIEVPQDKKPVDTEFPSKKAVNLATKINNTGTLSPTYNDRRTVKLTKAECEWLAKETGKSLNDIIIIFM